MQPPKFKELGGGNAYCPMLLFERRAITLFVRKKATFIENT